jgi:hypothetical protein
VDQNAINVLVLLGSITMGALFFSLILGGKK